MPQTVDEIKLNGDGTLAGIEQEAPIGRRTRRRSARRTGRWYYVNEREGSNYFGQSLLRPSFAPWLIKDQVLRVHATSIRRFGMGIPDVRGPPARPRSRSRKRSGSPSNLQGHRARRARSAERVHR
jgi:hypothetical protein